MADTGFFDVAVGFYRLSGQAIFHALALRWNGRTWSQVTVPTPAGDDTRLPAVTTVTPANNWAVGSDASHSLIEHQNNTSSWSLVPSPASEPAGSELDAISAVSANDIWAVGHSRAGTVGLGFEPLIEHWDTLCCSARNPSAPTVTSAICCCSATGSGLPSRSRTVVASAYQDGLPGRPAAPAMSAPTSRRCASSTA